MTRRRLFDWVLIAVLTGSWAVLFARGFEDGLRTGRGQLRLGVASASSADTHPMVVWGSVGSPPVKPGDALVEVEGADLRGASALRFYDVATRSARERGSVRLLAFRDGERFEARNARLDPSRFWWIRFVNSACLIATGVLLLVCAPAWHLARRTLFAFWCFAVAGVVRELITGPATAFEAVAAASVSVAGWGLLVWNLQDFSRSAPRVPHWQRVLPISVASIHVALYLVVYHLPHAVRTRDALIFASIFLPVAASLLVLTRGYRKSSGFEQRQIRWIVLGFYVGLVGIVIAVSAGLPALFPRLWRLGIPYGDDVTRVLLTTSGLALPASMIGAVLGSRWLDVDRLISSTASWTILGVALFGGALALVPQISSASAPLLGLRPAAAQWLLTLGLLLAAMPAHRVLWPRLDQQLFQTRHRRMAELDLLLDEIGRCESLDELAHMPAERVDALLEPVSIVLYTRTGTMLEPRLVRGASMPPPIDADSMLVRALERRAHPLAADSADLDPFDRAALETLGVELVVPTRGREAIVAITCLGPKRSGDIYSGEEIARLAAIANRCSEVVLRLTERRPDAPPTFERHPQIFRREGDLWTIASNGKEVRLRDMRGLRYLAMLLCEPRREFAALDLVQAASGLATVKGSAPDPDLRIERGLGDAGPVLDAQARNEYRARVAELERDLADAERCADLGRIERASAEREALLAELESSARGARSAPAGSDAERARVAVTKAIKTALDRIAEAHPELGAHLASTVRRGYVCTYDPDPSHTPVWEV